MIWLFKKLFGWDYAAVDWVGDVGIYRVKRTAAGEEYITICGTLIFRKHSRQWEPITYKDNE